MRADLIVSLDCSTTSCKAIIWDLEGNKVSEGRSDLTILNPKPRWYEQTADSWWSGSVNALQEAVYGIKPIRLLSICISHQRETFVPVNGNGNPIRNAILWMDERAEEQLSYIDKIIGRMHFHEITGKPLSGNLSIPKIAWLQQHEPEVYGNTGKFLDVHAYLVYQLTGKFRTSFASADPLGLFNLVHNQWAFDLMKQVNIDLEKFPEAFPPGKEIGEVTAKAAEESGLPAGLPVISGIGDGQSTGLGSKIINLNTAYLSLGTSIICGHFSKDFEISDNFRTMYGGIKNTYFLETVILSGTFTISWFIEKILRNQGSRPNGQQINETYLESEARKVQIGAQGLIIIPYLNGAMNPYWDANASGIIFGLRGIHGIGHIYRAILEGISFEQRLHTSGVEQVLGRKVNSYIVSGGGANSDLWCQIIANVTGKNVQRLVEREATALGAGILAASASRYYANTLEASEAMVHYEKEIFYPNMKKHQFYTKIYNDVYRLVYPALRNKLKVFKDN